MKKFNFTESAAKRIKELADIDNKNASLRVSVEGGGCSGFKYQYNLDDSILDNDQVFQENEVMVIIDVFSLELINGSVLDYIEELDGAYFEIRNPNAKSGCGCGNSFSI